MRVCIFGGSFLPRVGGMEYVMHNLADTLQSQGDEVTVIVKWHGWSPAGFPHTYSLARYGLPLPATGRLGIDFIGAVWVVWREHRRKPFDVIHCHGVAASGRRAAFISRLLNIPLVMTPHGEDVQRIPDIGYGLRLNSAWDRVITKNLQAADTVTAISESIRREIDFLDEGRVVIVPNGIFTDKFSARRSSYLQDFLGLPEGAKIILSVGRNHIKKGYAYGIKSMYELLHTHDIQNFHYVLVGRGMDDLQQEVADCGLEDWVSFVQEVPPDKVQDCYNSSQIFFSPSIVEGLSLVSIEAIACGLPLVVTDVPGNEDVVRENNCGIIVKCGDVKSMAEGLRKLLLDPGLEKELGRTALEASKNYDWSVVAKHYQDVYRKVAG